MICIIERKKTAFVTVDNKVYGLEVNKEDTPKGWAIITLSREDKGFFRTEENSFHTRSGREEFINCCWNMFKIERIDAEQLIERIKDYY